jgi:chromosome segregation ATPase
MAVRGQKGARRRPARRPAKRVRVPAPPPPVDGRDDWPAAPPSRSAGEHARRLEAALEAAEVLLEEKDREIVRLKRHFQERMTEFEGQLAVLQQEVRRARGDASDARQVAEARVRGVEQQLRNLAELLEGLEARGQVVAESTQAARGTVEALQQRLDQLEADVPPGPHHQKA